MGGEAALACWYERLARHATSTCTWLTIPNPTDRDGPPRRISYAELFALARSGASWLQREGLRPGDALFVLADNSAECCLWIISALLAGGVIVPIAPASAGQIGGIWVERLTRIKADCGAQVALVPSLAQQSSLQFPRGTRVYAFAQTQGSSPCTQASIDAEAIQLIQYTSGTTTEPRGVQISFANIVHNLSSLRAGLALTAEDVFVSWLPLFHDMGLIGSFLLGTYWGLQIVLSTPRSFALRPESWLRTISRFAGTCSVAPNSAYHLCAERISPAKLQGLDLRRWRCSVNGAELIHPATLARFSARFSAYGYRADAMFAVYGLAENTLAATLPRAGAEPEIDWVEREALERAGVARPVARSDNARGVVCVGRSVAGQSLRIVEPDMTRPLEDRRVGEVQILGPSTTRGYRGHTRAKVFTSDGYLRTGDRGYLVAGELYVVGRTKQIIKRAGHSLDCAFIENAVRDVAGIRAGAVAVFGVPDPGAGTERVVVMAETQCRDVEERAQLEHAIAAACRERAGFGPDRVALVRPGYIPRTTSGKIRHHAACAAFLEGFANA